MRYINDRRVSPTPEVSQYDMRAKTRVSSVPTPNQPLQSKI